MNEYNLLPCPFCGGKAELKKGNGIFRYVQCCKCEASSCVDKPEIAVESWNKRVPEEEGEA